MTLRNLITNLRPALRSWPRTADSELIYLRAGHLDLLQSQKRVLAVPDRNLVVFKIVN
jgi:hypothetical protein